MAVSCTWQSLSEAERRILILGNTGNGKSATVNTIIGRVEFESRPSTLPVTTKVQFHSWRNEGRSFLIVDTPALFYPSSDDYSIHEMSKIIGITYPGFHVLIFVVKVGRFTEQEVNAFKNIEITFGPEVLNKTVILFTGLDDLQNENMQFFDYVKYHIRPELKHIISKCGDRVVGFNNRADDLTKSGYVKKLLDLVENLFNSDGQTHSIFKSFGLSHEMMNEFYDGEIKTRKVNNQSYQQSIEADLQNEIRREIVNDDKRTKTIVNLIKKRLINYCTMILEQRNQQSCCRRMCNALRNWCKALRQGTRRLLNGLRRWCNALRFGTRNGSRAWN